MPVNVPTDPKVYTTKYANLRGVDYTNDPSNVWYRRSPNGLNMLPNLDGQPFKRNGWKVEFTAQDFIETSGITGASEVEQYKVDYFELGGAEYLWFYTSIGCFYYADELVFVDTSYEIGDDAPYDYSKSCTYAVGDYCMYSGTMYKCTSAISTPETWNSGHWTDSDVDGSKTFPPVGKSVDYGKSFFFEGGGRAGYYLFAGDEMYWFDGTVLHEGKPKIPVVLTMADATGTGTLLEDINMLTPWRAIDYLCDGTTDTYIIPDGAESVLNVFTINADGSFTPNYNWTMPNNGQIYFGSNPPAETRPNQPSMRVVYKTANATFSEERVTSNESTIQVTRTSVTKQPQKYTNSTWQNNGTATNTVTYECTSSAVISLVNAKMPPNIKVATKYPYASGQWTENVSDVSVSLNSYGSAVTLTGGKGLWERNEPASGYVALLNQKTSTTYTNVTNTTRTKVTTVTSSCGYSARVKYDQWNVSYGEASDSRDAFFASSKSLVYGNGIINQVFLTASKFNAYSTRVWYSAATDPTYFPDTNYIEVGATDKHIMGLIKVDDYLGVIKQGSATDTSVYLAYATSFEDITTYAVKQSVNGIGAISNGAFNILNGEPLFLSAEGVMGIEPAEDESRKIRNRSYYINKKLLAEPSLESAFSFVFDGMYWLCVNNHCYVLDGSQKVSWENSKTNLQYECYYLENVPAKCFARKDGKLWFVDYLGNVCRFRNNNDENKYADDYMYLLDSGIEPYMNGAINITFEDLSDAKVQATSVMKPRYVISEAIEWNDELRDSLYSDGYTFTVDNCKQYFSDLKHFFGLRYIVVIDGETYTSDYYASNVDPYVDSLTVPSGESWVSDIPDVQSLATYTIECYYLGEHETELNDLVLEYENFTVNGIVNVMTVTGIEDGYATLSGGVPIKATWGTIADDDGSANYYKKLQKRGSLVAVMPMSDSGVKVYLIPDEKDPIFVGETDIGNHILPFNYYLRKKVKNYKRLQIVCENASYNDGFGVDEIIKCYTIGNYAKR